MKKSQRMNSVIKLTGREEQQQAELFGKQRQYCEAQRQKLNELQQYYQDYSARLAEPGVHCDLQRMQDNRLFISKLAKAIDVQKGQVNQAESALENQRRKWLASRQRNMSVEKLQQRYADDEQRESHRQEQIQADEMSAQRFVWSRASNLQLA